MKDKISFQNKKVHYLFLLVVMASFLFQILFAAQQTSFNYIPSATKMWQENETAHGHVALQEQTDEGVRNSECAYYCTARDSKFE